MKAGVREEETKSAVAHVRRRQVQKEDGNKMRALSWGQIETLKKTADALNRCYGLATLDALFQYSSDHIRAISDKQCSTPKHASLGRIRPDAYKHKNYFFTHFYCCCLS